ncbi:hypothetical protein SALBM311S_04656 [Streptomyces alboniger]
MQQERVAFPDAEGVEHADRGLDGDGQCRGEVPVEVRGLRAEVDGQRVLGVCAGDGPAQDLVTHRDAGHAFADLVDDAGRLHAGDHRERRGDLRPPPVADLGVERVDPCRHDLQPHLPGSGVRLVDLFEAEDFRAAELGVGDRLHVLLQCSSL